jgi:transcriptional regulator with XRE-family HTH domain
MIRFAPEKITVRREELGMSQADLAEKIHEPGQSIDSTKMFVSRLENGKNMPTAPKLCKIAEALKTDVNYFFEFTSVHALEKPKAKEALPEKGKPNLEKLLEDLRSIVEAEKRPSLSDLVELEPGQKAVVVVLDEPKSNAIKTAFSLMQGIKAVVDVPLNGKG